MKIVINIPEEIKGKRDAGKVLSSDEIATVCMAIKSGTPLPKGHGDLIDRSNIYKATYADEDNLTGIGMTLEEMDAYNSGIDAMYALVRGAKPIIEADKEK